MSDNSFDARATLRAGDRELEIYRLDALQSKFDVARLPFSLKVLLENLLRTEGNGSVGPEDIEALASWDANAEPSKEIAFSPARVLMQDFTGVPAVVDLAAMRDAMGDLGGDAAKINPLVPAELVIDHSVQVDFFAQRDAFERNAEKEFERNEERYAFLRWGQTAFDDFAVVPPDTGIVHQVSSRPSSAVAPSGCNAELAGLPVLAADANAKVSSSWRRFGTLLAGLLAVALVLLVAFRDARRALVPLVPIALATGWSSLVLFVLRIDLNPMSVTLGALVIAISTEFSVLLAERYRQERAAGQDRKSVV